jgi:hypothetical protein
MALPFLGAALDIVGKVLDRVIPDPKAKAEAMLELQKLEQSGDLQVMLAQMEINKVEAASPDRFVSGWRPGIGWVCGGGMVMAFIVSPLVQLVIAIVAVCHGQPFVAPPVDMSTLGPILLAMLGLGGMRTFEKYHEVENKR